VVLRAGVLVIEANGMRPRRLQVPSGEPIQRKSGRCPKDNGRLAPQAVSEKAAGRYSRPSASPFDADQESIFNAY
jgi:hypothetical protein